MKQILSKCIAIGMSGPAEERRSVKVKGRQRRKKKKGRKHLVPTITRLLFGRDVVPAFSFSLMRLWCRVGTMDTEDHVKYTLFPPHYSNLSYNCHVCDRSPFPFPFPGILLLLLSNCRLHRKGCMCVMDKCKNYAFAHNFFNVRHTSIYILI